MATNGRFGHLGQSEVSENGPNEFPMPQNLGIDTKIKYLAHLEPKLKIWPFQLIWANPKWPQMAVLATQANLRCLKIVPMNFPWSKTLG